MGLDGDMCVLEAEDREVLVDLAFEETNRLVKKEEYGFYSREKIADNLKKSFGLTNSDLEDVFYYMDIKYERELIKLGVIVPNPSYT